VEVVEHQHNRLRQPLEALLQVSHELLLAAQGRRHQRGERVAGRDRDRVSQRVHDHGPEACGVRLVAPHARGHRTGQVPAAQPRRQQHRLPAPGRRRDQRHGTGGTAIEQREQARAHDQACGQPRYRRSGEISGLTIQSDVADSIVKSIARP
jgi:hypothetical protein